MTASPSVPPSTDLLALFRQKAGPILAEQRGMTAACLVKLAGLARELGLPDEQREAAIRSLRATDKSVDPAIEKLHHRLKKDLAAKKNLIIGPEIEAKVLQNAAKKYALEESLIRQVLADVAIELGLRRITGDEALQHFMELVDQGVGDSTWLAKESWDHLRAAGEKWGLTFEEAEDLVAQRIASNQQAKARGQLFGRLAIFGAVGAIACSAIAFVLVSMRRNDATTVPSIPNTVAVVPSERTPNEAPSTSVKTQPDWWDVDLAVSLAGARRELPDFASIYDRIGGSPAERNGAYDSLVSLGARLQPASAPRQHVTELIAGLYALDPDESSAEHLRASLLKLIPGRDTLLSRSTSLYERAFWAAETAQFALHRAGIPPARAEALAAALSSATGASITAALPIDAATARLQAALTSTLFSHLTAQAAKNPKLATPLHAFLTSEAATHLSREELEPLQAAFLLEQLGAVDAEWQPQEELIVSLVQSKNPLTILKMLELFQRTNNLSLQRRIGEELVKHTGSKPRSNEVKDIARAVRQALGAVGSTTLESQMDRWESLQTDARAVLAGLGKNPDDHSRLLRETVELARLATQAVALSQGESGLVVFDELREPTKTEVSAESPTSPLPDESNPLPSTARPLSNREKQQLEQFIAGLRAYADETPVIRANSLRALANVAPLVPDLSYDQAVAAARYLLAEKSDGEHAGILPSMATLRRFKQLRLALADEVETTRLTPEQLRTLAQAFLGFEVSEGDFSGGESSREFLRQAFLKSVASELDASSDRTGVTDSAAKRDEFVTAAGELTEAYRGRLRVIGFAPAEYLSADSPGQTLEFLARTAITPPRAAVSQAPSLKDRLEVANFLGSHDLRHTVLLQRLVLSIAVERISAQRPSQAEAASLIVVDLEASDAKATSLLMQLRDGEAAMLHLGMLYATN